MQNYKKLMALAARVKVSGIKDLSNARYCAGMGVYMLGFDVAEITATQLHEIRNWLSGVLIVVETHQQDKEHLAHIFKDYQPDFIHVKNQSSTDFETDGQPQNILLDSQFRSYSQYQALPEHEKTNYIIEIKADSEIRPGFSNFDGLMEILESLEVD